MYIYITVIAIIYVHHDKCTCALYVCMCGDVQIYIHTFASDGDGLMDEKVTVA